MTNPEYGQETVLRVALLIHEDAKIEGDIVIYNHQDVDSFPFSEIFDPHSPDTCVALMEKYGDGIDIAKTDDSWTCMYFFYDDEKAYGVPVDYVSAHGDILPEAVFACAVKITEEQNAQF